MRISGLFLVIFVIAGANVAHGQSKGLGCDNGWFGSSCQYKCRCSENRCDDDGECTGDAHCEKGWFGPACQYIDQTVTSGKAPTYEWLLDGDDSTCNPDPTLQNVTIFLNQTLLLNWFRFRVNDPAVLLEDFELKYRRKQINEVNGRKARVDATTLDIQSEDPELFYELILKGTIIQALCSVYITSGRNVGIGQKTMQSSTMDSLSASWHLVDGDTNGNYTEGSCSATSFDGSDPNPHWNVSFSQPTLIYSIEIFRRSDEQITPPAKIYVSYFGADSEDVYRQTGSQIWMNNAYFDERFRTGPNLPGTGFRRRAVSSFSIEVANQNPFSFCEIALYGDSKCEEGRYGKECEHTCNCAGNGTCFVSTGGCPSGCADGYTGESCHEDIDECASNNGGCDHTCINFVGYFHCTCSNGYQLSTDDRRTCQNNFCVGADTEKLNDRCVRLVNERVKWQEAKAACEALGPTVSLAELTSNAVREYVQNMTAALGSRAWLGATDAALEGQWVWSSTGNDSDIDPSWWGRGQPDNYYGNENCLIMRPDKLLNDYNCNFRLPYFCQSFD